MQGFPLIVTTVKRDKTLIVTVLRLVKELPYPENCRIMGQSVVVTLLPGPNSVTITGKPCTIISKSGNDTSVRGRVRNGSGVNLDTSTKEEIWRVSAFGFGLDGRGGRMQCNSRTASRRRSRRVHRGFPCVGRSMCGLRWRRPHENWRYYVVQSFPSHRL